MVEFKINNIFNLSNRGQVLIGEIIKGELSAGGLNRIYDDRFGLNLNILSIEFVDQITLKKAELGIMLGRIDDNACEKIRLMIGQTILIENIKLEKIS